MPLFAVAAGGGTPGLESACYNLINGLLRRGAEIDAWVTDSPQLAPAFVATMRQASGATLHRSKFPWPISRSRFFKESAFAIARRRTDQVIYPNYFLPPTERQGRGLVSAIIHDCLHHVHPEYFSATKRAWLNYQFDRTLRQADVVYLISEWEKQMIARFHGTQAADRCRVIFNSIDWPRFDSHLPSEIPGWEGRPVILSVCHPYPHKNVPLLIEAFGRLCERDCDALLALSGKPSAAVSSAVSLQPQAVRERIRFLGRLSDHELGQVYRSASLYVTASRYEGFGMPVVEALGFGLPTIIPAVAALPEVSLGLATILPGRFTTGELADAMHEVLRKGSRLVDSEVRLVRETFSIDAQAARILDGAEP